MQTTRHLLCPVDLSALSVQALRYAAALRTMENWAFKTVSERPCVPYWASLRYNVADPMPSLAAARVRFPPTARNTDVM